MLHNLRAGAAAGQSGGGRHLGGRFAVARVPWPSGPKEVLTSLARPSFSVYNFQSSPVGYAIKLRFLADVSAHPHHRARNA